MSKKSKRKSRQKISFSTLHIAPNMTSPPPADVVEIVERVSSEDRAWFEAHPGISHRQRSGVAREFWPDDYPNLRHVLVVEFAPAHRMRIPILDGVPAAAPGGSDAG